MNSIINNYGSGIALAGAGAALIASNKLAKQPKVRMSLIAAGVACIGAGIFTLDAARRFASSCQGKLEQATSDLLFCPAAKQRWEEVKKAGPISVECGEHTQMRPMVREISVRDGHRPMASGLLFELNNLKIAKKFQEAADAGLQCDDSINCVRWADNIEKIEGETVAETHRIASECVSQNIWPPAWDEYHEPRDLVYQEMSGHTQNYRIQCLDFIKESCNFSVANEAKILRPYYYSPGKGPWSSD